MEPFFISVLIDQEIKFNKTDLEALKDSENGYLHSKVYCVCTISNVKYFLRIFPNGSEETIRGKVCMFFDIMNGNAVNVDSDITLSVKTANYKHKLQKRKGPVICQTSKFFDSKFFEYGEMTVKVEGTLKITLPKKIRFPFSVQWKVKEADLEPLKTSSTNDSLQSKRFSVSSDSDIQYFLKIYPNGNNDEYRGQTWFFLHVCLENDSPKVEAVYNISIPSNNFLMNLKDEYDKSKGWGARISSTDDLFNPDNRYIVDGGLVFKITGTILIDKESNESTTLACEKGIASKAYQRHRGKEFTVVAGGRNIKVHKKVLIEASPVFEAMFNSGMKEVTEKKTIIPDFPAEIVEAALKLLYSDSIPSNFTFEQILLLLQFADKYDIKLIMDLVQNYLISKISPSNVCYLINFTTTTTVSATKLYSKCVEYLIKYSKESQAIHGFDTLDKDFVFKTFMGTFSQTS